VVTKTTQTQRNQGAKMSVMQQHNRAVKMWAKDLVHTTSTSTLKEMVYGRLNSAEQNLQVTNYDAVVDNLEKALALVKAMLAEAEASKE
jgi:hypothetical protein